MITYKCTNSNDLSCETSICPVCHKRTTLVSSSIFYCKNCDCPSFYEECQVCGSHCERIGSDIRPVFAKERLLIEIILGTPMKYAGKQMWNVGPQKFFVSGEKISLTMAGMKKVKLASIFENLKKFDAENQQFVDKDLCNDSIIKFVNCNKMRLNSITDEAISYIKKISKGFDSSSMFVSFSGGKDSTVTSDLVMRALGTESVIHIYGDTTLEYPTSTEYIKSFRKEHPQTPVLIAKNKEQNFTDLCSIVGPPSRVMRWCCTIFKTGAIAKKIEQTFGDKKRLLSFQGIRRSESISRSKYDRDTNSPKIAKQLVASPIIDWLDFDDWLYLLGNKVGFNFAYRQGFSRVGCWCCPNNSERSEFLSEIYMNDEYNKFRNILYMFAKTVGKEDWKEYVDSGNWKARQGGNGLEYSRKTNVEFKPCAFDENSLNFDLIKPISPVLYTLFKPFGILNFDIGNKRLGEVYVLDRKTQQPLLKLSGKIGNTALKVTVINSIGPFKIKKEAEMLIKNQITKFQMCLGCLYCQSVCRFGALKVSKMPSGEISYTIDDSKCVGCLECVTHFDGGCYMKKILRVKKGE